MIGWRPFAALLPLQLLGWTARLLATMAGDVAFAADRLVAWSERGGPEK